MKAQTAVAKLEKTAFWSREIWSGESVVTIGKRTTVGPRLPKHVADRLCEKLNAAITDVRLEISRTIDPRVEQVAMELEPQ